jgi:hypothetical protein
MCFCYKTPSSMTEDILLALLHSSHLTSLKSKTQYKNSRAFNRILSRRLLVVLLLICRQYFIVLNAKYATGEAGVKQLIIMWLVFFQPLVC